ncbi:hypothetical protein FS837_000950, partial [Tulasnella sp. UAMH 9824]
MHVAIPFAQPQRIQPRSAVTATAHQLQYALAYFTLSDRSHDRHDYQIRSFTSEMGGTPSTMLSNPLGYLRQVFQIQKQPLTQDAQARRTGVERLRHEEGRHRAPAVSPRSSLSSRTSSSAETLQWNQPDEAVAWGSALQGGILSGESGLTRLSSSTSAPRLSASGGVFTKITPRNTVLNILRIAKEPTASTIDYGLKRPGSPYHPSADAAKNAYNPNSNNTVNGAKHLVGPRIDKSGVEKEMKHWSLFVVN